jgi:hypothetical protein
MFCQSDADDFRVVNESQFGTNLHEGTLKNVFLGGISGDAFLSGT